MTIAIAILAIFVPVVFMKGIMGKFFYQFGVTMTVAVLLSLLEALTLAPMRCSQYLEVEHTNWLSRRMDALMDRSSRFYRRSLEFLLDRRWTVVIVATVLFASSLFFAGISSKLSRLPNRIALVTIGWVVFLATLGWILTFPVSFAV